MSELSIPTLAMLAVVFFFALGFFLFAWGDDEMVERMLHSDDDWID